MDQTTKTREDWIELLMVMVFEKARKESNEEEKEKLAKHLVLKVNNAIKERNFVRYFDGYLLGRKKYRTIPRDYNLTELCRYLNYKDFTEFRNLKDDDLKVGTLILKRTKLEQRIKKHNLLSIIVTMFLSFALIFFIINFYKKNCMIWVEDHFEKTRCTGIDLEEKLIYNRLVNFKKVQVCKDSIFFENGEAIKFYLRQGGRIEFFTQNGEHPIYRGRFLDPVTPRIIDNWVIPCDSIK